MGWLGRGVIPALLFCYALPAFASAPGTAKDTFLRLNDCATSRAITGCRDDVTEDSHALFDRFDGYGLASCLPDDVTFMSQTALKNHTIIRAKTAATGKTRYLRLLFSKEHSKWKLDIPASLHQSMGEDWEKRLSLIEALYVALRQQMGDKLDCNTARALAK
jgi:hypothetical protein